MKDKIKTVPRDIQSGLEGVNPVNSLACFEDVRRGRGQLAFSPELCAACIASLDEKSQFACLAQICQYGLMAANA